jgi:glycine cleavage system pyridoxal-binding protein P
VSFLSLTERDRDEMLATIGIGSIEELFRDIPEGVRFDRELDLEPALSEQEIVAHLRTSPPRTSTRVASSRSSERGFTTTTCRPWSMPSSREASS